MKKKDWSLPFCIAILAAVFGGLLLLPPVPVTNAQVSMPFPAFNYNHQSTNGTFAVSTIPGIFHTIVINTSGASSNTISIYDGSAATGRLIAVINGTMSPNYLQYDAQYNTNLTVVSATGTAADFTVTYRP